MNIKEQAVKFITLGEPCTLDDLFDKLGGYDTFHTVHGDKDRPNPKPIPQKADFNNEADFVEALERYSAYIRVPLDHPSEGGCWCNNDNKKYPQPNCPYFFQMSQGYSVHIM